MIHLHITINNGSFGEMLQIRNKLYLVVKNLKFCYTNNDSLRNLHNILPITLLIHQNFFAYGNYFMLSHAYNSNHHLDYYCYYSTSLFFQFTLPVMNNCIIPVKIYERYFNVNG